MKDLGQKQLKFIDKAIGIAKIVNNNSCWHFGAVLTSRNRIISIGKNNPWRTHRRSNTYYHNIHAEFDALLGVPKDRLIGSTLYIVRLGYDFRKHLMMARPCSCCEFALRQAGVKEVFYSVSDNFIGYWNLSRNEEYQITKQAA